MNREEPQAVIENRAEYLFVKCPPCADERDCSACIDLIFDTAAELEASRALADFTSTTHRIPTLELLELGCQMAERSRDRYAKIAIVSSEGAAYADPFFENVTVNRGADLRIFKEDMHEATSWLLGSLPEIQQ